MKRGDDCLKFEGELSAYLEGEDRSAILAHAEVCGFCRCLLADMELVSSVGHDVALEEPPPAVWANIRAALLAEGVIHPAAGFWQHWLPSRNRGLLGLSAWPLAGLAATAAAVAVLAVVLFQGPRRGTSLQTASAGGLRPADVAQNYDLGPRNMAQAQQTIQRLEEAYYANASSMEPSLKATYAKSIQSLDDEIRECQVSMQQQPENTLAQEYLSSAYMQKAQLLQSALEYNLR
ncbi:MAG: hypothetical protein ACRD10_00770 [Terriglobia bacterium]